MSRKQKIVAIIQARLTSTRLPRKILSDLNGKPLLSRVIERVKQAEKIDIIVLAIPDSSSNDELESFVKTSGWNLFRGSENDVLTRYYQAATQFEADVIVRVTSDCPLVDPKIIDQTIEQHMRDGNDYTAVGIEGGFPRGLDVEVFNYSTLEIAWRAAVEKSEREHVTLYINQNPTLFKVHFMKANGNLWRPEIRLTVDTEEDLQLARELYSTLNNHGTNFSTQDVLAIIDNFPNLQSINTHVVQKDIRSA